MQARSKPLDHERKCNIKCYIVAAFAEDDYGYPGLLFLDGHAIISFHQRDGLHMARIPIGWIYE